MFIKITNNSIVKIIKVNFANVFDCVESSNEVAKEACIFATIYNKVSFAPTQEIRPALASNCLNSI